MISDYHIEQTRFADVVIETEWRQNYYTGCAIGSNVPQLHLTTFNNYATNRSTHQIIPNAFCQYFWRAPYSKVTWSATCHNQAGFVCTYDSVHAYDYCHTWDEVDTVVNLLGTTCGHECGSRVGILEMSPRSTPSNLSRPVDTAAYNSRTRHSFVVIGALPTNLFITVYFHADFEYVRAPHIVTLAWVNGNGEASYMCNPIHFVRHGAIIAVTHNVTNHSLTGTSNEFGFYASNFYNSDTFSISVSGTTECEHMVSAVLSNDCSNPNAPCDIPIVPNPVYPEHRTNQHRVLVPNMTSTMIGITFVMDECGTACTKISYVNLNPVDIVDRAFTLNITDPAAILAFSNDSVYFTAYGYIGRVSVFVVEADVSCTVNFLTPVYELSGSEDYELSFRVRAPIIPLQYYMNTYQLDHYSMSYYARQPRNETPFNQFDNSVYDRLRALAVYNEPFLPFDAWNYSMPTVHNQGLFFPETYQLLARNFSEESLFIFSTPASNVTLNQSNCGGEPGTSILWYREVDMIHTSLDSGPKLSIKPTESCAAVASDPLLCDAPVELDIDDEISNGYKLLHNISQFQYLLVMQNWEKTTLNNVCKSSYLNVRKTISENIVGNTRIINDTGVYQLLVHLPCMMSANNPVSIGIIDVAYISDAENTIRLNGPNVNGLWAPTTKPRVYGWSQCKLFDLPAKPSQPYWALDLPSRSIDSGHYVKLTTDLYNEVLFQDVYSSDEITHDHMEKPENITLELGSDPHTWRWTPYTDFDTLTMYNFYIDITCNKMYTSVLLGTPYTHDPTLLTISLYPTWYDTFSGDEIAATDGMDAVPMLVGGIPLAVMPYTKLYYRPESNITPEPNISLGCFRDDWSSPCQPTYTFHRGAACCCAQETVYGNTFCDCAGHTSWCAPPSPPIVHQSIEFNSSSVSMGVKAGCPVYLHFTVSSEYNDLPAF